MMQSPGCLFKRRMSAAIVSWLFIMLLAAVDCNNWPVQSKQSNATKVWMHMLSPCQCRAKPVSAYVIICIVGKHLVGSSSRDQVVCNPHDVSTKL